MLIANDNFKFGLTKIQNCNSCTIFILNLFDEP
nr:MAG TPA: hypothetical protein [Caudoviricetes sp.]